jgi:hypothetical protein
VTVPHDTTPAANEANLTAPITSIVSAEPVASVVEQAHLPIAPEPVVVAPAPLVHQPEQGDLLASPLRQHASSASVDHSLDHSEKASESAAEDQDEHTGQRDNKLS